MNVRLPVAGIVGVLPAPDHDVGTWFGSDHELFRIMFASAYCTSPLLLMNVAFVLRVNVRRGSRTPVVKSSESVEPSPFAGSRLNLLRFLASPVK